MSEFYFRLFPCCGTLEECFLLANQIGVSSQSILDVFCGYSYGFFLNNFSKSKLFGMFPTLKGE